MKKNLLQSIRLVFVVISDVRTHCYWCAKPLKQCGTCRGSGQYKGLECRSCKGQGIVCPTHEGDWE